MVAVQALGRCEELDILIILNASLALPETYGTPWVAEHVFVSWLEIEVLSVGCARGGYL